MRRGQWNGPKENLKHVMNQAGGGAAWINSAFDFERYRSEIAVSDAGAWTIGRSFRGRL